MTELSSNAYEIAKSRYFSEGENWEDLCRRVGNSIAMNEHDKSWSDIFANEIFDMNFIPGGRILRNSGKLRQSLLNCACLPISDSIESIGETIKNSLILWSYGAGIGIDFTPLRPKGAPLISKGGESSGMCSFLEAIDSVAHTIETGGQRRSGCLGMLKVHHPEIYKFIDAKLEDKKLSYFNLSVAVDNRFLTAVEKDDDWDLTFTGKTYKTVKARDLWDKILDSMIKSGDPGLINFDNLIKNNSYYFQNISSTNLCSELPLPAYGMCCLGSLVLPKFLSGKNTNWKKLEASIDIAVRFLDDVLDVNFYPIKETEEITRDSRRIGLGVMGLHDYLMAKGICYGSERSVMEVERLFRFMRDTAYKSSIKLSTEKGAFPKFSRVQYSHASFIKKLPAKIRMDIKKSGIRNCVALSCQPTGTSSLIADVSSGIEPVFSLAYKRKDRVSERYYIHPKYIEHLNDKKKPEWLVDTSDLKPEDHFEIQCAAQRFVDNATSKTINCPSTIKKDELSSLLLEYIWDLKGITVYVDKSKEGQVLNKLTDKEIKEYLKNNKSDFMDEVDVSCVRGSCEI